MFWVISLCVGMFGASYYISELWDKWESGPVLVSIDSTAHPVSTIPFPAVTIWEVFNSPVSHLNFDFSVAICCN